VLGNIGAEYVEKWKRFEALSSQQTLSARFHAGRTFGEVLLDVLALIGGGATAVKAASKIPRLAKLAGKLPRLPHNRASGPGGRSALPAPPERAQVPGRTATVPAAAPKPAPSIPSRPLFSPKAPAGTLEPGAVPGWVPEFVSRPVPAAPAGHPPITPQAAGTFARPPVPVELKGPQVLYRIVGHPDRAKGPYWSLEPPPGTEAAWRSGSAVQYGWNNDGAYVTHTIAEGETLRVWKGPAASQQASDKFFHLPGGQEQVWIPKEQLNLLKPSTPQPTPWNK
jgi:hypothetical protein